MSDKKIDRERIRINGRRVNSLSKMGMLLRIVSIYGTISYIKTEQIGSIFVDASNIKVISLCYSNNLNDYEH